MFFNLLRSEKRVVKINHLTLTVKGTNVYMYGDSIFSLASITALGMESLGNTLGSVT